MGPVDRVRVRVADALASGVLTIVITAIASSLIDSSSISGSVFNGEAHDILLSLALLPLVLTLLGWALAVFRAGPFGLFGYLFEWGGVSSLLNTPDGSDLGVIVFGAVLVVFGAFVWSWTPVLEHIFWSRNRRAPPPGGFP